MPGPTTHSGDGRLWRQLVQVGLEPKEAAFYLAALQMREPTVAEVALAANISRTNAYDIAAALQRRGLLELTHSTRLTRRAGTKVLRALDPGRLVTDWHARKATLDEVVPALRVIREQAGPFPRSTYYEGAAGIRQMLFETLSWGCDMRAIMSMTDLYSTIGRTAVDEYVRQRARRKIFLKVIRSLEKDTYPWWKTSAADYREARSAPASYVYTMTSIIGRDTVVMLSSSAEDFALKIESEEYATMQANLFDVLWSVSDPN